MIGSMQDLIDRVEETKLRVRDLQVEVSRLAHDAGAIRAEIGAGLAVVYEGPKRVSARSARERSVSVAGLRSDRPSSSSTRPSR
jgi:hypothetical protein